MVEQLLGACEQHGNGPAHRSCVTVLLQLKPREGVLDRRAEAHGLSTAYHLDDRAVCTLKERVVHGIVCKSMTKLINLLNAGRYVRARAARGELHDLIRKVRRHLVDQAYRLTPSKIAQTHAVPAIFARSRAEHGRTNPPDLAGIHGHPWRTRRMTVSLGH